MRLWASCGAAERAPRVLVVHPGALGDVLLAIPAIRALRIAGVHVAVAAQPRIADLLVALHEADEALAFDGLGLEALFTADELAPRLPMADHLVCWFGARDAVFTRRLGELSPGAVIAPSVGEAPVWRHLLTTVGGSEVEAAPCRVPTELLAAGAAALEAAGWDGQRRVVVVHPGAGGLTKRWPTGAFAEALAPLLARGDLAVVLHDGPADGDAVTALAARLVGTLHLKAPSLPTLAGVLRQAALYVGNDCGVSHLAAAVGAPAVVLFAPANLAWRSWQPEARVVDVTMGRAVAEDVARVAAEITRRLG